MSKSFLAGVQGFADLLPGIVEVLYAHNESLLACIAALADTPGVRGDVLEALHCLTDEIAELKADGRGGMAAKWCHVIHQNFLTDDGWDVCPACNVATAKPLPHAGETFPFATDEDWDGGEWEF